MGQAVSDARENVDSAVEQIDVLVWNQAETVNTDAIQCILRQNFVFSAPSLQKIEDKVKIKKKSQNEKHAFFVKMDTQTNNLSVNNLRNFHFQILLRYDLAVCYLQYIRNSNHSW